MTRKSKDTPCPFSFQDSCSLTNSPRCVNHIIYNNTVAVLHITHQIHLIYSSCTGTLLNNHCKTDIFYIEFMGQTLFELFSPVDTTCIRRYNNRIMQVLIPKMSYTNNTSI